MATGTFILLATLALTLSAMPSLMGEAASSKSSCKQQQIRYRKPTLDTLPWPGYWVPLMIILGGCCGLAWCILYMSYNISQRGEEELPQLPSKAEEPAIPLDGQKAWSRTLFRTDTEVSNMGTGNSPWLENMTTSERIGSSDPLEKRFTNVGIGSSPWLENNLTREPERSTIQLERKATSKRTGMFSQQLESNVAAERVGSFTHFENNAPSERIGSPALLENYTASERIGGPSPCQETSLPVHETTRSVPQLENKISTQTTEGPASQGASEPPSHWPGRGEEASSSNLWRFMEKELEKLLGALRLHHSSKPIPPEEPPNLPSEEPPVPPPPATEAPSPPPATEAPNPPPATEAPSPQAEAASSSLESQENQPWMLFIIHEVPRSRSRSPPRGRGCKRRCTSKKRK